MRWKEQETRAGRTDEQRKVMQAEQALHFQVGKSFCLVFSSNKFEACLLLLKASSMPKDLWTVSSKKSVSQVRQWKNSVG